jgi:hypothetical protein
MPCDQAREALALADALHAVARPEPLHLRRRERAVGNAREAGAFGAFCDVGRHGREGTNLKRWRYATG